MAQPTVQPAPVASAQYAQAPVQEQGSSAESPPVALAPAAAENTGLRFGQGLQVAFSVDNVFGYGHTWSTLTPTKYQGQGMSGFEEKNTSDTFTFLGSSDGATLAPQLGVDVVVKGFTIGGSLMYASNSGERTEKDSRTSSTVETKTKNPGTSAFGIGVRGGYVLMFNDYVGIWPRAGLSYRTATTKLYSSNTPVETEYVMDVSGAFVSPELMLVVSPVPHLAFLVGAGASIALTGSFTDRTGGVTGYEGDVSGGTGGLAVGVLGYL